MLKSELKPWLQKVPWVLPIYGIVLLLSSPVVMPVIVLWVNWNDVVEYYKQCMETFERVE